jgi:hypothetical protein
MGRVQAVALVVATALSHDGKTGIIFGVDAFSTYPAFAGNARTTATKGASSRMNKSPLYLSDASQDVGGPILNANPVAGPTGAAAFKGCQIEQVPGSLTTFTIRVDGEEADLGRFAAGIYKRIVQGAKQERFQGFRPGTIPPHLDPTYRAFSMDECAREATLEAMEQNSIKPFENAPQDFEFGQISIPPPIQKGKKKKKKGGRKGKNKAAAATEIPTDDQVEEEAPAAPEWLTFDTMKGAVDAGWKPGQNFSFVVRDARGQQFKDGSSASGIGASGGLGGTMGVPDLNEMAAAIAKEEAQKK